LSHKTSGTNPPARRKIKIIRGSRVNLSPGIIKVKHGQNKQLLGTTTMARYEINNLENSMGGETRADVFCEMGLMYATGRGCEIDLVSAHKWLNIAAIKGSERAASLRADLAQAMSKMELARALRAAREWMTMH
jgi:uncharacterized protein